MPQQCPELAPPRPKRRDFDAMRSSLVSMAPAGGGMTELYDVIWHTVGVNPIIYILLIYG